MNTNLEEQEDELLALQSIFDSEDFVREESKFAGKIRVLAELPTDFSVVLNEGETVRLYEISYLPPLILTFDLPEDYPSSSPPSFSLSCSWLSHTQIAALSAQLVDLYQATGGAVVLFTWVQFLREDALKFLDIQSVLELPADGVVRLQDEPSAASSCSIQGAASVQEPSEEEERPRDEDLSDVTVTPSQALLSQILIYDAAQKQRAFDSSVFDCGVCFTACLGSGCVRVSECGHIFCQACLAEFCRLKITEGNVRSVTCPQAQCSATPSPAQVKRLVGEELFVRYDRLLLQLTLDDMSDIVYCPRPSCAVAVIRDKSTNAALCSKCGFAFCVNCQKTFHGIDDCMKKKKVEQMENVGPNVDLPKSGEGRTALQNDYTTGSKQRKRLLEDRYGKYFLQCVLEAGLSSDWIAQNSKPCPHCFRNIEKNGGCNSMSCSQCHQRFCWACLTKFTPAEPSYQHFQNGSCSAYGV